MYLGWQRLNTAMARNEERWYYINSDLLLWSLGKWLWGAKRHYQTNASTESVCKFIPQCKTLLEASLPLNHQGRTIQKLVSYGIMTWSSSWFAMCWLPPLPPCLEVIHSCDYASACSAAKIANDSSMVSPNLGRGGEVGDSSIVTHDIPKTRPLFVRRSNTWFISRVSIHPPN